MGENGSVRRSVRAGVSVTPVGDVAMATTDRPEATGGEGTAPSPGGAGNGRFEGVVGARLRGEGCEDGTGEGGYGRGCVG